MDAIAILGAILGVFSLVLSIYNTIVLKAELLTRAHKPEQPVDTLDRARAMYPGQEVRVGDDEDLDSPWNRTPENDMEELLR